MDVCDRSIARNNRYRTWIDKYQNAAKNIADQLQTNTENILGLSALESGWGSGPFVANGRNNFFSLHSPAPFENGFVFTTDKVVKVSTFKDYETCALAFAKAYGKYVTGIKDAKEFAKALQKAKKYGINRDGTPVESFATDVANTSASFKVRLNCK